MIRPNIPMILSSLLVAVLIIAYLQKDKLNDFISGRIQDSAPGETILSGQQWVDSLFNYAKNKADYEYTLIQFKSTGCTLCKQMEPELEHVKKNKNLKVNVAELNVMNPNSLNVMKYYGISTVPTILILDREGTETFRKYGFVSAEELHRHFIR